MGTTISATIKSNLRDDIKANIVPLVTLGQEIAAAIQVRVHDEGLAGDGAPWSEYKSKRKPPKKGDRFYWTKVGDAAPDLHRLIKAEQGPYAGRSAYPSYAHYREALGASGTQKRFMLTGELRNSLMVSATSANKVTVHYSKALRVSPYGKAKSGKPYTNEKVAQFAFRTERTGPMQLSDAEVNTVNMILARDIPPQILKDASAFAAEAKSNRLIGQANRALKGSGIKVQ